MLEAVLECLQRVGTFLADNELVQIICLLIVTYLVLRAFTVVFLERRADVKENKELIRKFLDQHQQASYGDSQIKYGYGYGKSLDVDIEHAEEFIRAYYDKENEGAEHEEVGAFLNPPCSPL